MNKESFISNLENAFSQNSLSEYLTKESAEKLYFLAELLINTNKEYNLTAITDENEIILKHFIDCAVVLPYIKEGASLIDVGCGAGFPSLPIAILRKDVKVTAIDSTGKKILFVSKAANDLCLDNVVAYCARAEDHVKLGREDFDVCTSRAVASLNLLDELCLPFVKLGGLFIAMKSSKGSEEYEQASNGIVKLGGSLEEIKKLKLDFDGSTVERELYLIRKSSSTPPNYPRNYSQIAKKPL